MEVGDCTVERKGGQEALSEPSTCHSCFIGYPPCKRGASKSQDFFQDHTAYQPRKVRQFFYFLIWEKTTYLPYLSVVVKIGYNTL